MSGARPCRYIQPIEAAFTAATLWSAGPGPMTAPGRRWESGQDWDAQYRPGIPGSFQVLQKELHCDPIRAADEGDGHDHQQHGEVSDSRRLPGDNRDRPTSSCADGGTDRCGEASPGSQPGRRVRVLVCAAERDRKQAIRAAAGEKSRFPPSADAKGMRPDHRSGTPSKLPQELQSGLSRRCAQPGRQHQPMPKPMRSSPRGGSGLV